MIFYSILTYSILFKYYNCIEDLSNIRDSSLKKGKDFRSKVHRWPYAKGQFYIAYKAKAVGINFELVDPRNTSRGCSACGYVSASNRRGLHFCCQKCGHKDDADRQASKNIRLRSVVAAQVTTTTGSHKAPQSSEPPDIVAESPVLYGDLVSA